MNRRPLILLFAVIGASSALAETMFVRASLTAAQEVPPPASAGVGTLAGTFDTNARKLTWSVTYSGLTSPATAAHFHGPAPAGRVAPVTVPAAVGKSPIEGAATLSAEQAKALLAGDMYFNIHTELNRGGEIRGQVEVQPEPERR